MENYIKIRAIYRGDVYEVENIYFQDEYVSLFNGNINAAETIKVKISECEIEWYDSKTGLSPKQLMQQSEMLKEQRDLFQEQRDELLKALDAIRKFAYEAGILAVEDMASDAILIVT